MKKIKRHKKRRYIKDKCLCCEYKTLKIFDILLSNIITKIHHREKEIETPSNYEAAWLYEADKNMINYFIGTDQKIPKRLMIKLARARRQLERRGVIAPFSEIEKLAEFK